MRDLKPTMTNNKYYQLFSFLMILMLIGPLGFSQNNLSSDLISTQNQPLNELGDDCFNGNLFDNVEDISNIDAVISYGSNYRAAVGFVVAEETDFILKKITLDVLSASPIELGYFKFKSDNHGKPGAELPFTVNNLTPIESTDIGVVFGVKVWRLVFELPEALAFSAGTYWLEPTMKSTSSVYLAYYPSSAVSGVVPYSQDYGESWKTFNGFQTSFLVTGECFEENTDCIETTIWNGTNWSNGFPSESPKKKVIFEKEYTISSEDIYACSVEVKNDAVVKVLNEFNLIVDNEINISEDGLIIVKDGANLVQKNDEAENIGTIQVEKRFTFSNDERKQYNFVTSPVEGQHIKKIFGDSSSNIPFALIYNTTTDFFVVPPAGAYTEKRGFAIKEPKNTVTDPIAKFEGVATNGKVDFELSTVGNGYNVVGNPYPSNIDLQMVYKTNSEKIEPSFWFWDNRGNTLFEQQGSEYKGSHYAVYNAINKTGSSATAALGSDSEGLRVPDSYATVGTGFMVKAINGEDLELLNIHRTTDKSEVVFFGKGNNFTTEMDRYWLTMTTPGNIEVMSAVVYFDDGDDAFTIDDSPASGGSDALYTLVDEHELAIQGKAPFSNKDVVSLGYNAYAPGFHTISIHKSEGVFADGQKIYIKDKLSGTTHDLTTEDYVFKTAPGEFNDRFEIIYKKSHKASENQAKLSNVIIQRKDHNIDIASEEHKITDVEVYDLNGTLVYSKKGVNAFELKIPNSHFSKHLLFVLVKTESGEVLSKRLINN